MSYQNAHCNFDCELEIDTPTVELLDKTECERPLLTSEAECQTDLTPTETSEIITRIEALEQSFKLFNAKLDDFSEKVDKLVEDVASEFSISRQHQQDDTKLIKEIAKDFVSTAESVITHHGGCFDHLEESVATCQAAITGLLKPECIEITDISDM